MIEAIITEIVRRIISKMLKGTLILFLVSGIGCASAPVPESYPVGSAPWEIEARDKRISELEERLGNVEVLLLQTREAAHEGFKAMVELEEARQGKGGANESGK